MEKPYIGVPSLFFLQIQATFWIKLVIAMVTTILHVLTWHELLDYTEVLLDNHIDYKDWGYFTPSCFDSMWTFRWSFFTAWLSHWLQVYFTPSCFDSMWTFRCSFLTAWWSHWLQVYFTPSCFDSMWTFRWSFLTAWWSHWLHVYFTPSCFDFIRSFCLPFYLLDNYIHYNYILHLHVWT